jgi:threonine dehydrogenase-like Zn-dependent dehydrogenase
MADVEVVVADLAPERLEVASSLGAASVASSLDGEFDLIFDGVGASATRHASIEHLRPGGTAVWLGLMDSASPVDGLDVVRSEKRVLGSFCYSDGDFADAVQLCRRLPTEWVTSFPLSRSDVVFTELMHGRTDIAKAVFVP